MPMNDAQIREAIKTVLAKHSGPLYSTKHGTADKNPSNAKGDDAFEALQLASTEDINAAAQAKEGDHDSPR